jgi:outer membrane protein TolC
MSFVHLSIRLAALLFALPTWAAEKPLAVGDISKLDLAKMSALLGTHTEPAAVKSRRISLDEALRMALKKNLQIQIATLNVETAEPEVDATRAKFHPVMGAEGGHLETQDEFSSIRSSHRISDGRVFVRQDVPTGGSVTVSSNWIEDEVSGSEDKTRSSSSRVAVEVRQPLLRGGRIYVARRLITDAEYDLEIQQALLAADVFDVTAQTKIAYYNAVLGERLIDVVKAAIRRDEALVTASNALFEAGRVTKRDVVSAEIQLSKDRIELASRRAEWEVAQNRLREVLGTPIGDSLKATDRHIPFRPIELRLDDWIRTAFENRPELLAIRKQAEKADLETQIRKNDVLPVFDVLGSFNEDYRASNRGSFWRVGGLIEIPLGNVAARRRLETANAQQARVDREYTLRQRVIEIEVREIEIRLRESIGRLRDLIHSVEQARAKRQIALARFELGRADNLDITNADEDLVSAESDLLRAVVDYASNLALLEARMASPI